MNIRVGKARLLLSSTSVTDSIQIVGILSLARQCPIASSELTYLLCKSVLSVGESLNSC